jgi:hypothetical protein
LLISRGTWLPLKNGIFSFFAGVTARVSAELVTCGAKSPLPTPACPVRITTTTTYIHFIRSDMMPKLGRGPSKYNVAGIDAGVELKVEEGIPGVYCDMDSPGYACMHGPATGEDCR